MFDIIAQFPKVDCLICNAGVLIPSSTIQATNGTTGGDEEVSESSDDDDDERAKEATTWYLDQLQEAQNKASSSSEVTERYLKVYR